MTSSTLKISFEFFPPKTKKMAETLWQSVKRLEPLNPRFVSVTYGAGGTTRERCRRRAACWPCDRQSHQETEAVRPTRRCACNPAAHSPPSRRLHRSLDSPAVRDAVRQSNARADAVRQAAGSGC